MYKTVIGLEVHVELNTERKIFCKCISRFGDKPNTNVCPVCMGMPGALPVLNEEVLKAAVIAGLATNCKISSKTRFDRKNYFYPDNPQGYQISQLYMPINTNGYLDIDNKRIRIHEIHMEDDAGKLIHDEIENITYIDFNRSGVPLLEIVTEPDLSNADETIAFLEKLKSRIGYTGISDCRMQEGSMRVDVNLSVHKEGEELGTRTEMKNLSSFRSIRKAIECESMRQITLLESGGRVVMETRRFDEGKNETFSMRSKEEASDYRYFPEPDIPVITIEESDIETCEKSLPEFREEKIKRFMDEYSLSEYDAVNLTEYKIIADFYESTVTYGVNPKSGCNWITGELYAKCKENGILPDDINIKADNFASLINLVDKKVITKTVAKDIFELLFTNPDLNIEDYVIDNNLATNNDEETLTNVVEAVIQNNERCVNDYKNGKEKAIMALVGMCMRELKGQANANVIKEILLSRL